MDKDKAFLEITSDLSEEQNTSQIVKYSTTSGNIEITSESVKEDCISVGNDERHSCKVMDIHSVTDTIASEGNKDCCNDYHASKRVYSISSDKVFNDELLPLPANVINNICNTSKSIAAELNDTNDISVCSHSNVISHHLNNDTFNDNSYFCKNITNFQVAADPSDVNKIKLEIATDVDSVEHFTSNNYSTCTEASILSNVNLGSSDTVYGASYLCSEAETMSKQCMAKNANLCVRNSTVESSNLSNNGSENIDLVEKDTSCNFNTNVMSYSGEQQFNEYSVDTVPFQSNTTCTSDALYPKDTQDSQLLTLSSCVRNTRESKLDSETNSVFTIHDSCNDTNRSDAVPQIFFINAVSANDGEEIGISSRENDTITNVISHCSEGIQTVSGPFKEADRSETLRKRSTVLEISKSGKLNMQRACYSVENISNCSNADNGEQNDDINTLSNMSETFSHAISIEQNSSLATNVLYKQNVLYKGGQKNFDHIKCRKSFKKINSFNRKRFVQKRNAGPLRMQKLTLKDNRKSSADPRRLTSRLKRLWHQELKNVGHITCPISGCSQKYMSLAIFQAHYKWCSGGQTKGLQHCPYCGSLILNDSSAFLRHMEVEHPDKVEDYKNKLEKQNVTEDSSKLTVLEGDGVHPHLNSDVQEYNDITTVKKLIQKNVSQCQTTNPDNLHKSIFTPTGLKSNCEKTQKQSLKKHQTEYFSKEHIDSGDMPSTMKSSSLLEEVEGEFGSDISDDDSVDCLNSDNENFRIDYIKSRKKMTGQQNIPRSVPLKMRGLNDFVVPTRDWAAPRKTYSRGISRNLSGISQTLHFPEQAPCDEHQLDNATKPTSITVNSTTKNYLSDNVNELESLEKLNGSLGEIITSPSEKAMIKTSNEQVFIQHVNKCNSGTNSDRQQLPSVVEENGQPLEVSTLQKSAKKKQVRFSLPDSNQKLQDGKPSEVATLMPLNPACDASYILSDKMSAVLSVVPNEIGDSCVSIKEQKRQFDAEKPVHNKIQYLERTQNIERTLTVSCKDKTTQTYNENSESLFPGLTEHGKAEDHISNHDQCCGVSLQLKTVASSGSNQNSENAKNWTQEKPTNTEITTNVGTELLEDSSYEKKTKTDFCNVQKLSSLESSGISCLPIISSNLEATSALPSNHSVDTFPSKNTMGAVKNVSSKMKSVRSKTTNHLVTANHSSRNLAVIHHTQGSVLPSVTCVKRKRGRPRKNLSLDSLQVKSLPPDDKTDNYDKIPIANIHRDVSCRGRPRKYRKFVMPVRRKTTVSSSSFSKHYIDRIKCTEVFPMKRRRGRPRKLSNVNSFEQCKHFIPVSDLIKETLACSGSVLPESDIYNKDHHKSLEHNSYYAVNKTLNSTSLESKKKCVIVSRRKRGRPRKTPELCTAKPLKHLKQMHVCVPPTGLIIKRRGRPRKIPKLETCENVVSDISSKHCVFISSSPDNVVKHVQNPENINEPSSNKYADKSSSVINSEVKSEYNDSSNNHLNGMSAQSNDFQILDTDKCEAIRKRGRKRQLSSFCDEQKEMLLKSVSRRQLMSETEPLDGNVEKYSYKSEREIREKATLCSSIELSMTKDSILEPNLCKELNAGFETKKHVGKTVGAFICGACKATFNMLSSVRYHILSVHNGQARVNSSLPLSEKESTVALKKTLRILKRLVCLTPDCDKVFHSFPGYLNHERYCGKEEQEVVCDVCGENVKLKTLNKHRKIKHSRVQKETDSSPSHDILSKAPGRRAAIKAKMLMEKFIRKNAVSSESDLNEADYIFPDNFEQESDIGEKDLPAKLLKKFKGCYEAPQRVVRKVTKELTDEWQAQLAASGKVKCKFEGCGKEIGTKLGMIYHYQHCQLSQKWRCLLCGKSTSRGGRVILHHMLKYHYIEEGYPGDEGEICGEKGCYFPSSSRSQVMDSYNLKPLLQAVIWALKNQEKHGKSELFPKWMPSKNSLKVLQESEYAPHLPPLEKSIKIKIEDINKNTSSCWMDMKLFETLPLQESSCHQTFFVGGPVWACAWCPTPLTTTAPQYIALATCSSMDGEHHFTRTGSEKGLLQVWHVGNLEKTVNDAIPSLSLAIAHNHGAIFDMVWCPSGCWEDPSDFIDDNFPSKNEMLPRMGLLAVTSGDGLIRIYSIPHPESIQQSCSLLPVYSFQPVAILMPPGAGISLNSRNTICVKLSWQVTDSCRHMAAGYGSGIVCVWDLVTTSPLLVVSETNHLTLSPSLTLPAHGAAISGLAWAAVPGGRFLVTAAHDRNLKFWDLNNLSLPVNAMKKGLVRDVQCLSHWCGAFGTLDDCYNVMGTVTFYKECGYYNYLSRPLASHNACAWRVSLSEWLNTVASCDASGEVVAAVLCQLMKNVDSIKQMNHRRIPIYRVDLEPLSSTHEKCTSVNLDLQTSSFKSLPSTKASTKCLTQSAIHDNLVQTSVKLNSVSENVAFITDIDLTSEVGTNKFEKDSSKQEIVALSSGQPSEAKLTKNVQKADKISETSQETSTLVKQSEDHSVVDSFNKCSLHVQDTAANNHNELQPRPNIGKAVQETENPNYYSFSVEANHANYRERSAGKETFCDIDSNIMSVEKCSVKERLNELEIAEIFLQMSGQSELKRSCVLKDTDKSDPKCQSQLSENLQKQNSEKHMENNQSSSKHKVGKYVSHSLADFEIDAKNCIPTNTNDVSYLKGVGKTADFSHASEEACQQQPVEIEINSGCYSIPNYNVHNQNSTLENIESCNESKAQFVVEVNVPIESTDCNLKVRQGVDVTRNDNKTLPESQPVDGTSFTSVPHACNSQTSSQKFKHINSDPECTLSSEISESSSLKKIVQKSECQGSGQLKVNKLKTAGGDTVETKPSADNGYSHGLSNHENLQELKVPLKTYSQMEGKFGLVYKDCNLGILEEIPKQEFQRITKPDSMNTALPHQYHLASTNVVSWNPNLGSHLWLFTAGQAGIARLSCVAGLHSPLVDNIIESTRKLKNNR